MGVYSVSQRTITASSASAAWEIIQGGNKPRIIEIGISQNAATASVFGLGFPAANGITPTTPVTALDESDGNAPAGATTVAVAWGTPPTVPAAFFRRVSTAAVLGPVMIWTFPQGLCLPTTKNLVLWNIGTNSVVDAWVVVQE